jgi:dienelactone hydrolase
VTRLEATRLIVGLAGGVPIIASLGHPAYDLFAAGDRPQNFYTWGAMGLASSIGLGLALARPDVRVIVIDGDGSLLMNLGSLATIGLLRPANLVLVVMDNEEYATTGGQPTPTAHGADLDAAARAMGIAATATVRTPEELAGALVRQSWGRESIAVSASTGSTGGGTQKLQSTPDPSVLLTGYGGFNISLTPAFDPSDFLWLDAGGVIAMAHLRGGGEYGDAWHRAGMRERKQNVFDDFIAAAEWLESTGRAARGRVAIEGGSNGGLLVGACLVQRPDLFGAAICRVPVADMLRYHLFTVGRFWIPEYGCADDAGDFPFLLRYSPYHNVIDDTAYPPTLVMTADTDDRVAPGMAKKFAARLQEAASTTDGGPILLRVETRAGHGAGKPVEKQVGEQADLYAFLFHYLTPTSVSEQTRR